jgi:hypothetical protein
MSTHSYRKNCGVEIKPTDTRVWKRIVLRPDDTVEISDSLNVKKEPSKERASIIKRILEAVKCEIVKKEIESTTINFGIISFTIKNKEKT